MLIHVPKRKFARICAHPLLYDVGFLRAHSLNGMCPTCNLFLSGASSLSSTKKFQNSEFRLPLDAIVPFDGAALKNPTFCSKVHRCLFIYFSLSDTYI